MAKSSASHIAQHATKKADSSVNKAASGKPHRIEFEVATGGLTSRMRKKHEPAEGGWEEPETVIHPTMKHAMAHLQNLSHAFTSKDEVSGDIDD